MKPPKDKYVEACIAQDLCFDYVLKPLREEVDWVRQEHDTMITEFELCRTQTEREDFHQKHDLKDAESFNQKCTSSLKKLNWMKGNLERAEEKYKRLTAIKQQLGDEMAKYFRDELKKTA